MPTYGIDTNIFLNVLREERAFLASSRAFLTDVEFGRVIGIISTVNLTEILTGAYRKGDDEVKKVYLSISKMESGGLRIVDVDRATADKGAQIRATHKLDTPDALIAATAILNDAEILVTRDKDAYVKLTEIDVKTPEELGYK
ncbi:MAG: type II toxin-antitoxin system VapC family toxin [Candidatus Geothermarchaeales archaeon]